MQCLRSATSLVRPALRLPNSCRLPAVQRPLSVPPVRQGRGAWRTGINGGILKSGLSTTQDTVRDVACCSSDGFQSEEETVELEIKVEGMMCGGCSSRVEEALKKQGHVKGVSVSLESKLATVEVEAPTCIDAMNMLPGFVQVIKDLGFEAEPHIEYMC